MLPKCPPDLVLYQPPPGTAGWRTVVVHHPPPDSVGRVAGLNVLHTTLPSISFGDIMCPRFNVNITIDTRGKGDITVHFKIH